MILDSDSKYVMRMIRGFIKIQEDILKNQDLSIKQIDDIKKLRQGLNVLSLQTNDAKMKTGISRNDEQHELAKISEPVKIKDY